MEAGSVLYTAVTAWSALKLTGDMFLLPARGKKVLVIGGSGGVGVMAVQLLKAWGAEVNVFKTIVLCYIFCTKTLQCVIRE